LATAVGARRGPGHGARGRGARLRALLHHQGSRRGHRARPLGRLRYHSRARRLDRAREPGRQGLDLLDLPAARARGCDMSEGRVLVVDDDAEMCALVETGLKKRGWEVMTRNSGDSALELLAVEDVDVIATDLNMRGMNG